MFTGLIQKKGVLENLRGGSDAMVIDIRCDRWDGSPLALGESVAVQGACLTVSRVHAAGFSADILPETLKRTAIGGLKPGAALNLERALRLSDRLGGHIVSGHIDGIGKLASIEKTGRDFRLRISCAPEISRYIVSKGSIALDGISLTVSAVPEALSFEVCIIPTTWRETSLSERAPGDPINLETDILGRYVEKFVCASAASSQRAPSLSLEKLLSAGFKAQHNQ